MYRVMQAANRYTPGREVSRKATLPEAKRSAAAVKGQAGGKDSTIWIDYIHRPGAEDEDYERVCTTHDGGI